MSFIRLCTPHSPLWADLPNYLDHKSNHSLHQTCRDARTRSIERSVRLLQQVNPWDLRGGFSLHVYRQWVKSFRHWQLGKAIRSVQWVTETTKWRMEISAKFTPSGIIAVIEIIPIYYKEPILNPNSLGNADSLMREVSQGGAWEKAFPLISPYVSLLQMITPRTSKIWIDRQWVYVPDLQVVSKIYGTLSLTRAQYSDLIYRFMIGFSRDSEMQVDDIYGSTRKEYCWSLFKSLMTP